MLVQVSSQECYFIWILRSLFVGDLGVGFGFLFLVFCFVFFSPGSLVALITSLESMVRFISTPLSQEVDCTSFLRSQHLPSKYCTFLPHALWRAKLVLFLIIRIHPGFVRLIFLTMYFKNISLNKDHCTSRHWPWEGKRYVKTTREVANVTGELRAYLRDSNIFFLRLGVL